MGPSSRHAISTHEPSGGGPGVSSRRVGREHPHLVDRLCRWQRHAAAIDAQLGDPAAGRSSRRARGPPSSISSLPPEPPPLIRPPMRRPACRCRHAPLATDGVGDSAVGCERVREPAGREPMAVGVITAADAVAVAVPVGLTRSCCFARDTSAAQLSCTKQRRPRDCEHAQPAPSGPYIRALLRQEGHDINPSVSA